MVERLEDEREIVSTPDGFNGAPTPSPAPSPDSRKTPSGLTAALRRARIENAERSDVLTDLHGAELTRLEMLREHLQPVFDEVPADCDIFDPGIVPGERPRLFIDMVAFVELGRDRRAYRLVQDSRAGRAVLAESERIDVLVRAITDYIARRLIQREKALASPLALPVGSGSARASDLPARAAPARSQPPRTRPQAAQVVARAGLFVVELIGSAVVLGAGVLAAYWLWRKYGH